jgi:GntR family transcriptional regulator/MocR family aminotransferase
MEPRWSSTGCSPRLCPKRVPRQRVLIIRLREAILSGRLAADTRLPASRSLAATLNIARNTVLFAYEQLVAEGCLVADRQGTRVALACRAAPWRPRSRVSRTLLPPRCTCPPAPLPRCSPSRRATPRRCRSRPGCRTSAPSPSAAWRACLERAWRDAGWRQLGYAAHGGDPALRAALAGPPRQRTRPRGGCRANSHHQRHAGGSTSARACSPITATRSGWRTRATSPPASPSARRAAGARRPVDGEGLAPERKTGTAIRRA